MSGAPSAAAAANPRNPAIKRIMREMRELVNDTSTDFVTKPLDESLFEWHFTIRGPPDTEFSGGRYHGRILLPAAYPFKPPDIIMMTPSGRFETGKKICLSISGFHPEHWQPSWSIRTVLVALVAFMPTDPHGAVGSLDCSKQERRRLAAASRNWTCPECASKNSECFGGAQDGDDDDDDAAGDSQLVNTPQLSDGRTSEASGSAPQPVVSRADDMLWTAVTIALFIGIVAILFKKALA